MISHSNMDIGKEIRIAQARVGVTNTALAKALGVSRQTVSNYRKAEDIKLSTLNEICAALGLTLKVTID